VTRQPRADARHIAVEREADGQTGGRRPIRVGAAVRHGGPSSETGWRSPQPRRGGGAFRIEPDLKEAAAGMRDVHSLRWASCARVLLEFDASSGGMGGGPARRRVELTAQDRRSGSPRPQEQPGVAVGARRPDAGRPPGPHSRCGPFRSPGPGRRMAAHRHALRGPIARRVERTREVVPESCSAEWRSASDHAGAGRPFLALRVGAAAPLSMTRRSRGGPRALASVQTAVTGSGERSGNLFVDSCWAGHACHPVIEALDQRGCGAPAGADAGMESPVRPCRPKPLPRFPRDGQARAVANARLAGG